MCAQSPTKWPKGIATGLSLVIGLLVSADSASALDDDILETRDIPLLSFNDGINSDAPPLPPQKRRGPPSSGGVDKRVDDDTLLPHPPPPINVKGAVAGDVEKRLDDDTLLPHPPPPINVKGAVAGDVEKRLDDDTLLPHPPPPINVKGAVAGGIDKRADDETLLPNPGSIPPLNVKGASTDGNSAVGAAAFRGNENPPESNKPEPCEPVATGGLLSGFGMAARAMKPCPQ